MTESSVCYGCNKRYPLIICKIDDETKVKVNQYDIGIDHEQYQLNSRKGVLTTLVRVKGDNRHKVMSVKSSAPIDKDLWIECSKALSRIYVGPNMKCGDVVCTNILNTGVDIISTKTIKR